MIMVIIYIFVAFILIFLIYNSKLNEKIIEGNDGIDETKDCLGVYDINGYGECDKPCGGGVQQIYFNITQPPLDGYFQGNNEEAIQCPEPKERPCNTHNCPIKCEYVGGGDGWGDWIKNLDSNGKQLGTETRRRQIKINEKYGGTPCGKLTETRNHDVNCVQSAWSNWGACSETCGPGTQTRTRSILQQPKNGGKTCEASEQSRQCNTKPCPVDCVQSAWSNWGACSKPCGGGTQTRTRSTSQVNMYGGIECGPSSDTRSCNSHKCLDCVGDWHWWGGCSGSSHRKIYKITRKSDYGGKKCPASNGDVSGWHRNACYRYCAESKWYGCKRHAWRRQ